MLFSFQTTVPRAFLTDYKIIYFLDCCKFGIGVVGGDMVHGMVIFFLENILLLKMRLQHEHILRSAECLD